LGLKALTSAALIKERRGKKQIPMNFEYRVGRDGGSEEEE
jgi:hypothetical protein